MNTQESSKKIEKNKSENTIKAFGFSTFPHFIGEQFERMKKNGFSSLQIGKFMEN